MQHHVVETPTGPATPVPPVRVLVEDPGITSVPPHVTVLSGFEVTMCSGPFTAAEPCPLVLDGVCPYGTPDVVVCALNGPWACSVQSAWAETGVIVIEGAPGGDAQRRMNHAIGAAVSAFFPGDRVD